MTLAYSFAASLAGEEERADGRTDGRRRRDGLGQYEHRYLCTTVAGRPPSPSLSCLRDTLGERVRDEAARTSREVGAATPEREGGTRKAVGPLPYNRSLSPLSPSLGPSKF